MVESPAINRENYIVFTAKTMFEEVLEKAPFKLGKNLPPVKRFDPHYVDFSGCYANLTSRPRSIISCAWADFTIGWKNNKLLFNSPFNRFMLDIHDDPNYEVENGEVVKIMSPWLITVNKPDTKWLAAKSLFNKTTLAMPSGITVWNNTVKVCPSFLYIPKVEGFSVTVKQGDPLYSFYPLSDLPIYVENFYDPSLTERIAEPLPEDDLPFAKTYHESKSHEKKTCPQDVS